MKTYNYLNNEVDDIINFIRENNIDIYSIDLDQLIDRLFIEDSVTGNGSGSYTFSTLKAEQNLVGNWDLLRDYVINVDPTFDLLKSGPEAADVIIRCSLLPKAVSQAFDILKH